MILHRCSYRLLIALLGLGSMLIVVACHHRQTASTISAASTSSDPAKAAVDDIKLIQGLPPKAGEPQTDPHAIAIMKLGKSAGPYLVAKLSDTTPSKVVYGFHYTIGDIALVLLEEIYQPPGWPFPDNSETMPAAYGDYRDYESFMASAGSRQRLQESWKKYIQQH